MTLPPPVFCSTKGYKEVRSVFKYVWLIEGQNFRDSLDPGRAPRLVCLPGRSPASPTLYDWPCIYIQVIIVLHAIPSDAYTDKNIHCPWLSISMNLMIRVADTHSSGDTCYINKVRELYIRGIISSTNFNEQFSLFINNMFVTLLSSTCFEH